MLAKILNAILVMYIAVAILMFGMLIFRVFIFKDYSVKYTHRPTNTKHKLHGIKALLVIFIMAILWPIVIFTAEVE